MQYLHQLSSKAISRAPELGGIFLLGVGVILLLSSLAHAPVFMLSDGANVIAGNRHGTFLLLLAFCALVSGYFIIRRYVSSKPNIFIWLVIAEVLAESSILGWLFVTSGLTLPLPSSQWSILSALWLENLLGMLGAIVFPVIVLCLCFRLKGNLRKQEPCA